MFSFSYKILITTVVNIVSQNLLTFIFGRLYTANAVGNFSQAFKWDTMASTMISGTTSQVAQPVLAEVKLETERQVTVFRKMLRFTAFLAFPAMFGLSMVAHEFIIVLISDKWADSIPLLRILCISGAFLPFYTLYQNLMISRGKSDVYLWITTSLIAVQLLLVLLCYTKGMIFYGECIYCSNCALALLFGKFFAYREISIRLYDVLCDIIPYMFISAVIIIAVYLPQTVFKIS